MVEGGGFDRWGWTENVFCSFVIMFEYYIIFIFSFV